MFRFVTAAWALRRPLALALLLIGLPVAGHAQGETVSEWKPFSMQTRAPDSVATLALQGSYRVFHAGTAFTKVEVRLDKGTVDAVPAKKSEYQVEKLHIHLATRKTPPEIGVTGVIPRLAYAAPSAWQLRKTAEGHYEVAGPHQTIVLPGNMQSLDKYFLYAAAWNSNGKSYFPALSSPLDPWTRHQSTAGGYSIEFPGPPELSDRPPVKMPGGEVIGHMAGIEVSDRRGFLVSYEDYPSVPDLQSFLDQQVQRSVIVGYTLRDSQRIDIDGVPARRFVADRTDLNYTMVGLLTVRGQRRYYVAAVVPGHEDGAPDVQRFLKSFTLTPPPAAPALPPGWITDLKSGCRFWDNDPKAGETVTWSGPCVGGVVEGHGTLEISINGKFDQRGEGDFKGGKANGRIVLQFADGERDEGTMRDNKRWGHWTIVMASGERFDGEYKNDVREGHGVYVWADGGRYEGEYSSDRPHGAGTFTRNGETYSGTWTNGCFQQGNRKAYIASTEKECGFK